MSKMFQSARDAAQLQRELDQCAKDFDELRLRVKRIKDEADVQGRIEMCLRVQKGIQEAIQIHENLINSAVIADQSTHLGLQHWLREYGTLKLNMGRQLGHTHYIIQHARSGDLVIARTAKHAHRLRIDAGCVNTSPNQPTIISLSSPLPMWPYNTVWIDGEFVYQQCLKQDLYSWLARMPVKKVIVLGS